MALKDRLEFRNHGHVKYRVLRLLDVQMLWDEYCEVQEQRCELLQSDFKSVDLLKSRNIAWLLPTTFLIQRIFFHLSKNFVYSSAQQEYDIIRPVLTLLSDQEMYVTFLIDKISDYTAIIEKAQIVLTFYLCLHVSGQRVRCRLYSFKCWWLSTYPIHFIQLSVFIALNNKMNCCLRLLG